MINEYIDLIKLEVEKWPKYKQKTLKESHIKDIFPIGFDGVVKKYSLTIEDIRNALRCKVDLDEFKCPFCGRQLHICAGYIKPKHCGSKECKKEFEKHKYLDKLLDKINLSYFKQEKNLSKEDIFLISRKIKEWDRSKIHRKTIKILSERSLYLSSLIKEFGFEDVFYHVSYEIELSHKFCPICGKKLHIVKKEVRDINEVSAGYQVACSRSCITKYYSIHSYEYFIKRNGLPDRYLHGTISIEEVDFIINKYISDFFINDFFLDELFVKNDYYTYLKEDSFTNRDIVYHIINNIVPSHYYCPICGKEVHCYNNIYKYPECCCMSCASKLIMIRNENNGIPNMSKLIDIKKKKEKSFILRYGVKTSLNIKESRDKNKKRKNDQSFETAVEKSIGFSKPEFCRSDWNGYSEEEYPWRCDVCGDVFYSKCNHFAAKCPKCFPAGFSLKEYELKLFLENKLGIKSFRDNKILNGLEIDILFYDLKKGIEFNGDFWHSTLKGKDKFYHKNKTDLAIENGYELIHIFECDYDKKQKLMKDISIEFIKEFPSFNYDENKEDIQDFYLIHNFPDIPQNILENINSWSFSIKDEVKSYSDLNNDKFNALLYSKDGTLIFLLKIMKSSIYVVEAIYDHDEKEIIYAYKFKNALLFLSKLNKNIYFLHDRSLPLNRKLFNYLNFIFYKSLDPVEISFHGDKNVTDKEMKNRLIVYNSGFDLYELNI